MKGKVLGLESSPDDLFRDSSSDKSGTGEVVQEGGEEFGIDGGEIETEERKRVPDPQLPHPDVIAAHNIDHTPYRSWCRSVLKAAELVNNTDLVIANAVSP